MPERYVVTYLTEDEMAGCRERGQAAAARGMTRKLSDDWINNEQWEIERDLRLGQASEYAARLELVRIEELRWLPFKPLRGGASEECNREARKLWRSRSGRC